MTAHAASAAKASGRKQQSRSQVTKDAILAAAVAEFAEFGPDGARIENIAARAGVNKQVLYYHYGDKEALYQSALAAVYEKGRIDERDWTADSQKPLDAMRDLIGAIFDEVRSNEADTALITHENRRHGVHLRSDVRKRIQRGVLPIRAAIVHVLNRGQRAGVFAKDANPDTLYVSIVALCMFYFTHAYTLSAILDRDLLRDSDVKLWKKHVQQFVLRGIRTT